MKTKIEKQRIIQAAIDALIDLSDINDNIIDYSFFIHSENSAVMKLRRAYCELEERDELDEYENYINQSEKEHYQYLDENYEENGSPKEKFI